MPEISIIVPVYKVEPYLRQCVDSILAQTFTDFVCVLVDDGSPDQCGAICDKYAEQDLRVRVVHQKNAGLSAARNAGIEWTICNGEVQWICFVDSDDVLSSCYLSSLLEAARKESTLISACAVERFRKTVHHEASHGTDRPEKEVVFDAASFLYMQMTGKIEMGVWNRLFHVSVVQNVQFLRGYLHEDIFFAADLLKQNYSVAYIASPLYYYRQRDNSIISRQVTQRRCSPDRIVAARYLLEKAKEAEYPYMDIALRYAVNYPWSFVDPIYVDCRFRENKQFLDALQELLRTHMKEYQKLTAVKKTQRKRMLLFARSRFLYGFNAYARLFRVYLYHILKKDPYADGHGI